MDSSTLMHFPVSFFTLSLLVASVTSLARTADAGERYEQTAAISSPEATQAAAANESFVYAISSTTVAKYDRATGERLAVSAGEAKHLNSGFLWEGKLYCAHSNYPLKPEKSEIKLLDTATMVLGTFKDFGESQGSLTWVVRNDQGWWCTFAYYGPEHAKTKLVKFDDDWQERGSWTYPEKVISDLGDYSISGGIWQADELLATGHNKRVIYRLRLPATGNILELVDVVDSPFPGQGIARDQTDGHLVGIDRAKRLVLFAELRK